MQVADTWDKAFALQMLIITFIFFFDNAGDMRSLRKSTQVFLQTGGFNRIITV